MNKIIDEWIAKLKEGSTGSTNLIPASCERTFAMIFNFCVNAVCVFDIKSIYFE